MTEVRPSDPEEFARELAQRARSAGRATDWFDELYRAADQGRAEVPWDRGQAHPLLVEWTERRSQPRAGRALVVGAGPGHDAELISALGYAVTAFDLSPAAVAATHRRFPASTVSYRTADLLALPQEWQSAFDLVVEIFTVQSLPPELHPEAIAAVRSTVAPGGTLLVIAAAAGSERVHEQGPPWPLTADEVTAFGSDLLVPVVVEKLGAPQRWRAELRRAR
jgi:SAM-dependent methyltransferase